jgi:hypothetical protein
MLTATLPTKVHENTIKPLYESIGKALEAMRVPRSIGKFAVACNDDVHGLDCKEVKEVSLGVPDVLVQFQDVGNMCLELWCIELSFHSLEKMQYGNYNDSPTVPHMGLLQQHSLTSPSPNDTHPHLTHRRLP